MPGRPLAATQPPVPDVIADDEARWSQLMVDARDGDKRAYEQLLVELGTAIEHYVRARFGGSSIVEDCVQECLLTVHQARHTYDPTRPFRPWLFTIVRHKAIDVLRRRSSWEAQAAPDGATDDAHGSPMEQMIARQAFAGLRADHKQALVLTKIIGLTMMEAATKLGISEGAMKVRVHRAVRAARKHMESTSP